MAGGMVTLPVRGTERRPAKRPHAPEPGGSSRLARARGSRHPAGMEATLAAPEAQAGGHPFLPGRADLRQLVSLAVPVVVVHVGLMQMRVVDTIMVGHVSAGRLQRGEEPSSSRVTIG